MAVVQAEFCATVTHIVAQSTASTMDVTKHLFAIAKFSCRHCFITFDMNKRCGVKLDYRTSNLAAAKVDQPYSGQEGKDRLCHGSQLLCGLQTIDEEEMGGSKARGKTCLLLEGGSCSKRGDMEELEV